MKVHRSLKRVNPKFNYSADGWFVEVDSEDYNLPKDWPQRKIYKYLSYKCLMLLLETANLDGCMSGEACVAALEPFKAEKEWDETLDKVGSAA